MHWKGSTTLSIYLDPLGWFDGKVVAILGEYLITTPNQDVIWYPPWGKRDICLCANVRYGFDDPTLWPQPYLIDYSHLSAIPRKPDSEDDPLAIMWWNPTKSDFISTSSNLVDGLCSLALEKFKKLDLHKNKLMRWIDHYKAGTNSPNHMLLVMSKAVLHACVWLSFLTTSFLEMKFGVTEISTVLSGDARDTWLLGNIQTSHGWYSNSHRIGWQSHGDFHVYSTSRTRVFWCWSTCLVYQGNK